MGIDGCQFVSDDLYWLRMRPFGKSSEMTINCCNGNNMHYSVRVMSHLLHCFIALLNSAGYTSASHTHFTCVINIIYFIYEYNITNSLLINSHRCETALIISFSHLWAAEEYPYIHAYTHIMKFILPICTLALAFYYF